MPDAQCDALTILQLWYLEYPDIHNTAESGEVYVAEFHLNEVVNMLSRALFSNVLYGVTRHTSEHSARSLMVQSDAPGQHLQTSPSHPQQHEAIKCPNSERERKAFKITHLARFLLILA